MIPSFETLKRFSIPNLRPGEITFFEMDASSFLGADVTVFISPGDRNPSNDSKKLRVPAR